MNSFLAHFSRWILATLVVLGAVVQSESFSFTQKPPRIVRVLEGTRKTLIWDFTASASKYFVIVSRQRPGETDAERIATRSESSSFSYVNDSYYMDYNVSRPATLPLKNVRRDDKYDYIVSILDESFVQQLSDRVTAEVVATAGTQEPPDPSSPGSSGLTKSQMWGIIGGCIALFLLIVIFVCCYLFWRWFFYIINKKF
ncbi:hypothetical protein ACROYT_G021862 [Oculina patagonica]